jgi:hypothetical protein
LGASVAAAGLVSAGLVSTAFGAEAGAGASDFFSQPVNIPTLRSNAAAIPIVCLKCIQIPFL